MSVTRLLSSVRVCLCMCVLKLKFYKDQRSLIDSRRKDYLLSTLQPKRITAVGWLLLSWFVFCSLCPLSLRLWG